MKNNIVIILSLALLLVIQSCSVKSYNSDSKPVTHELWDTLLHKYVNEEGKVNYKGFIQDSISFNRYLSLLKNNHPNKKNWSKEEQLAYWINAYNAFTVKLVADHYPVASIKDIKRGIPFVNTVWDIKFIQIEGATYDLNNIEHGIIRKQFEEPRIHFAVNCASVSCPNMRNEAFTAKRLDEQLTESARSFLADETKNKITADKLQLSKIFSWFKGDFTEDKSLIEFLNQYSPIPINSNADIDHLDYDWNLNE